MGLAASLALLFRLGDWGDQTGAPSHFDNAIGWLPFRIECTFLNRKLGRRNAEKSETTGMFIS